MTNSVAATPAGSPRRAPSPPATLILGHARAFQRDPLHFLLSTARDLGPVARLKLGPRTYHLVSEPSLVAQVLQDRARNYVRDTRSSRSIRLLSGESLLTSEGATWRRHRQMAQPIFHHGRIAALAQTMTAAASELATEWDRVAESGTIVDLQAEMSRITFTVAGRCLFGAEVGAAAGVVEGAFPALLAELFRRAQEIASWPMWLPLPRHRAFLRGRAAIDDVVARIVTARRRQANAGNDLLGLLLQARADDGSFLSDRELRDQVVTFLLAGHETTASSLTWALSLLAHHASEQFAVEKELDRWSVGSIDGITMEALSTLVQVQAVLQETLRLYPAIWIAERRVLQSDELGGFAIPAGSSVLVAPYVTQRLTAFWPDPDAFRPQRFAQSQPRTLTADGYFPFGAGPHACIGQHFALMEMKIILSQLLARFRVRLVDGELPEALGGITLRPAGAVPVRVERRQPR